MENLRRNDYEDNDSQTFRILTEFIEIIKIEGKLKTHESAILIKSAEALMARLD